MKPTNTLFRYHIHYHDRFNGVLRILNYETSKVYEIKDSDKLFPLIHDLCISIDPSNHIIVSQILKNNYE